MINTGYDTIRYDTLYLFCADGVITFL